MAVPPVSPFVTEQKETGLGDNVFVDLFGLIERTNVLDQLSDV
jgi:hypothetical protein